MDIKTKFKIGDIVLFLMAEGGALNVKLFKGIIREININVSNGGDNVNIRKIYYDVSINHTVTNNSITVDEKFLCSNDRNVIDYIFRNENLRQYLNKNNKEKIKDEDDMKTLDNDLDLPF